MAGRQPPGELSVEELQFCGMACTGLPYLIPKNLSRLIPRCTFCFSHTIAQKPCSGRLWA